MDTTVCCRLHVLVMMTMMSAFYWHCAHRSKLPLSRAKRCTTKSGDLHPRKLMSISRSIRSRKIVNLQIINICCPKKWGAKHITSPHFKKWGDLSPCPPYDRRPCPQHVNQVHISKQMLCIIIIIKAMRLTWYKCKSTARPVVLGCGLHGGAAPNSVLL